ncbi:MAG: MFS transporter [Ruminococcaceae bacterium]|nr:MFS transporter [Oscillospiraceae bacterium]
MKKFKPFGISDKVGYLFGDFGNDFTFLISSSFLLKFYTDVMAIDGYIVGIVMMVARFVDAFTDVMMGRICDRSKLTRVGKFKPWILRMCIPVALASFLIYQSAFATFSTTFKVVWLFVTYILWGSIFYTSINIPYGSMASAISPEPSDRQSLSTFRTMGGTLAGIIVGAGIPLFAYRDVDGKSVMDGGRFTLIAGIFSVLAVVCYILCYLLTTERVRTEKPQNVKGDNFIGLFKKAISNKALISIIVSSVMLLLSQLTMQTMANYIYPNYYGNARAQTVATFAMLIGMVTAAFIAKPLSARFGKAEISAATSILAAGVCIFLFFLRPESVWVYVGINVITWIGLGVFSMVSWALITDVIDYSEIKNGIREDGSIYALYSFARKIGQAAAAGLSGVLLTAIGYSENTAFDPGVLSGIFNIATLIPALGFIVLALVLWFWYPLHKKTVDENVRILKDKHQEE